MARSPAPAILLPQQRSAISRRLPALPPKAAKTRRSRPRTLPRRRSAQPWHADSSRIFEGLEQRLALRRLRGLNMRVICNAALCLGFALLAGLAAGVARADNDTGAGDHPNLFAIGLYQVSFHVHADDISGPFTPPGLNVRNPSVNTLYIAYMRRLSRHFDAELALGVPPLTRSVAKGPAMVGSVPFNGETIATVRWLAPNLPLKYYLFSPDAMFRPYLGLGVNYTKFQSRQVTAAGNAISGGPTSLSLPVSVGPVLNA